MLKFGNKEFRNLQEQVLKNMRDIADIRTSGIVLDEFGIKVVGQESSVANMPSVADYKLTNPDWAYGDAYAIGTEAPYTLYILTREDANHTDDYWFDIGKFPEPGPQGPKGDTGDTGPQGQTGNPGADGAAAGFGVVTASAITLEPDSDAQVSVVASGPNTEKSFAFTFGIPKGEPGTAPELEWGNISGDLGDQTDLVSALQAKQNLLVSGTNIKTISGQSVLGSGNIDISKLQATATIVIDALTNLNGRILSNFEATLDTSTPYAYYVITRNGSQLTEEQAKDYMEYMTGSRFLPVFDYETPENSLFIFANGSLWKPQFDTVGLKLYALPNPYALKSELNTKQDTLVSGTNIKTINNESILGSGNINIQGGGGDVTDVEVNGVSVVDQDGVAEVTVPTKTSDLTNDSGFITSSALSGYATESWVNNKGYAVASSLATVATSGSYNDLSDKPTIPVVNYPVTDVEVNGSSVLSGTVAQITVPTATSDLTNDSGFITSSYHDATKQDVISDLATIRSGAALGATAVQPAAIANMVTTNTVQTITGEKTFDTVTMDTLTVDADLTAGYIEASSIHENGKAVLTTDVLPLDYETEITNKPYIPTKTSDLTNDSGFITSSYHDSTKQNVISDLSTIRSGAALGATAVQPSAISDMATKTWVGSQGYAVAANLSTVATSGDYDDLTDKPTIGNATLTIQKNGTSVGTFTANATTSKSINITVPTNNNELTNGAGYQTASDVSTAIGAQNKETWIFTLEDNTTVSKTVVLE